MISVRSNRWKIVLASAVVLALAAFAISVGGVVLLTRRERLRCAEPLPSVDWAALEDVRLVTSDGLALGAWYCAVDGPGPAVVVLHGQGGSRSSSLARARLLAELESRARNTPAIKPGARSPASR